MLQNLTEDAPEDDLERRVARNATHLAYVKIALIGGAEVVAAARRVMIHIDAVAYGRTAFDVDTWNDVLDPFQEAARYNLTGQHDLAPIIADPNGLPRQAILPAGRSRKTTLSRPRRRLSTFDRDATPKVSSQ